MDEETYWRLLDVARVLLGVAEELGASLRDPERFGKDADQVIADEAAVHALIEDVLAFAECLERRLGRGRGTRAGTGRDD